MNIGQSIPVKNYNIIVFKNIGITLSKMYKCSLKVSSSVYLCMWNSVGIGTRVHVLIYIIKTIFVDNLYIYIMILYKITERRRALK